MCLNQAVEGLSQWKSCQSSDLKKSKNDLLTFSVKSFTAAV